MNHSINIWFHQSRNQYCQHQSCRKKCKLCRALSLSRSTQQHGGLLYYSTRFASNFGGPWPNQLFGKSLI
ncbi:uncharacterized protein ASCRUDRAFT_155081 [Ascoidea rubescens DSM 1968]|uniref:Uncharacterized protein n=1 Tax=Ascoidea rubescens DSM 1968 TaxID=1344418 RepID=A0A1D2VG94_9ASCO|nr:hypothetical protein ASCRUDRAFT_155081 [Ascoidea rubescens DSM 1968]ODV60560.1 hypothetical protein ASCRUDRAFT_155081 [Ascoidea rubescens DSM 1968]